MPIRKSRVSYTMDLKKDLEKIPRKDRKAAAEKIAKLIKSQILSYTKEAKSPVKGGAYTSTLTNKKYRDLKRRTKGTTRANLRLKESMLSNLKSKAKGTKIVVKIEGSRKDVAKAAGHNNGDYNGGVVRQFIPDDTKRQSFKKPIIDKINKIISSYKVDEAEQFDPNLIAYAEEERRKKSEDESNE